MLKLKCIIVLIFINFCFSQEKIESKFETKVQNFINNYTKTKFTITKSKDYYSIDSNLRNFKLNWSKIITLRSKKYFYNKRAFKGKVFQNLHFYFFEFDSNEDCSNGLNQILNNFGNDNEKLNFGVSGQGLKTTPNIYIINEKEIAICYIDCEHENDFWNTTFKNDFENTFGNENSKMIGSACHNPIKFKN